MLDGKVVDGATAVESVALTAVLVGPGGEVVIDAGGLESFLFVPTTPPTTPPTIPPTSKRPSIAMKTIIGIPHIRRFFQPPCALFTLYASV